MEVLFHLTFALGGGLGAVSRHLLTKLVTHRFPISTLIVNVAGCFILGLFTGLLGFHTGTFAEEERRLIFGFCGGFTTFSSFAYQSITLHRNHSVLHAGGNILLSFTICLVAYWFGLRLTML